MVFWRFWWDLGGFWWDFGGFGGILAVLVGFRRVLVGFWRLWWDLGGFW